MMRVPFLLFILLSSLFANGQSPTEILIVGSDHLSQVYKKGNEHTDVFTARRQKEILRFVESVKSFRPDIIMVEELPEEQARMDSLYRLYLAGTLRFEDLPDGRSEIYQIAFRLGKELNHKSIRCVNAPGGSSQGMLDNGDHIDIYTDETTRFRKIVSEKSTALQNGTLSFDDYLRFVNRPDMYNQIYHLRYITPARVTNGKFKNPDAMVDTAFINPRYIGAELSAIFKNRDYKIYSNIVTTNLAQPAKKMLLVIGVAHIGSLRSLFRDDPEYRLVDAAKYLNK